MSGEARNLTIEERFQLINDAWHKIKRRLQRWINARRKKADELPVKVSGMAFREMHADGTPHIHFLLAHYVPFEWLQKAWMDVGGGRFVHIKQVEPRRVVNYLTKYLAKTEGIRSPEFPPYVRRYSAFGTVSLKGVNPEASAETWQLELLFTNGKWKTFPNTKEAILVALYERDEWEALYAAEHAPNRRRFVKLKQTTINPALEKWVRRPAEHRKGVH